MERRAQWVTVALFALVLASRGGAVLSPIWPDVHPAWTVALIAALLFGAHRLMLYAEDRGWIYPGH